METTRYPLWKSTVRVMATAGYVAMVEGLSFWVVATIGTVLSSWGVTIGPVLGSWVATGIIVAMLALLMVGYRLAAKHGLRLYKYALAVIIGTLPVCVWFSLLAFRTLQR